VTQPNSPGNGPPKRAPSLPPSSSPSRSPGGSHGNSQGSSPGPARPVLVAGGAGYIGSHTVRLLGERGVPVVVVDNFSTGHRAAVQRAHPAALLVEGDLLDRAALDALFAAHRPRAVVHFAARAYVGESVTDPARYYRENVVATFTLLEAMRAAGCDRLVFSSTCATYGNPVRLPIDEAHPQAPISPYGRTKLHIEHMLEDFSNAYGLRYAALRYFNAAGAARDGSLGEHHEPETHLIPLVLQVALGQRAEIQVFGADYDTPDGTCVRDYIHVEDLALAHGLALERLDAGAQRIVANLGTGEGFSVSQVIETARRVTQRPIAARTVARRAGDPARLVSGGTLAREQLGWKPERPAIEDIVRDAWNFATRHPRGYAS
jgi:UDP-glucose 4-epimerase